MIWTPGREVYCWPGETVERLQVIAASMAGAGQLVAGSVDLVHLVALAFDGHGEPVSSRRAPAVPVATVPGQVVIWLSWAWYSRPIGPVPGQAVIWTPGKEVYCWPGGTVAQLQVIAASMAGGWPAGRRQCGSGSPGCPGRGTAAR